MTTRVLIALVTGATLGIATLAAPAAAAPSGPSIVDCAGALVSKPKTIAISCADGGISINNIRWSTWTMNGAKGRGTLVVNSCIYTGGPACVAVKTDSYPATITLGGLASGPGVDVFSQVDLSFAKGGPAGLAAGSYTIDNAIR